MHKLTENYLDYLNGDTQHLNEGFLSVLNSFLVEFGFGSPADARFQAIGSGHERCGSACWKAFPDEKTTTRQSRTDYNSERNESDISKEREEILTSVKKNPERGKCIIMCKVDMLKSYVDVIKKNRKKICMQNMNTDLCEKWVNKNLPYLEAELKALTQAVQMMKGVKDKEDKKVNIVINKLKKIL